MRLTISLKGYLWFICVFVSFLWSFLCLPAQAKTIVVASEIPGLHNLSLDGAYDRIVVDLLVNKNIADLQVFPPARALEYFDNCSNCCYSPGNNNPEFYQFGENAIETQPFNVAKVFIFSAPGQPVLRTLSDLSGKVVGARYGLEYGETFDNAELNVMRVSNMEEYLKLLKEGMIDAFVAFTPDAYAMFERLNIEPFPHDPESPLVVHSDGLVCKGVVDSTITYFNESLSKLQALSDAIN